MFLSFRISLCMSVQMQERREANEGIGPMRAGRPDRRPHVPEEGRCAIRDERYTCS